MIISNLGQEYAAIQSQSGQVLPQPSSDQKSSTPADANRVTISAQSASREASALKAHEKYTDAIERINQNSAANKAADDQDSIRALAELYEAWHTAEPGNGHDAKAAEWRAKMPTVESNDAE